MQLLTCTGLRLSALCYSIVEVFSSGQNVVHNKRARQCNRSVTCADSHFLVIQFTNTRTSQHFELAAWRTRPHAASGWFPDGWHRLEHPCPFFFFLRKALQDKAMQRQTSTNQRDAPGQYTGRSQGHLSSYLRRILGGAPGERHRARCKSDSRGCDTHCGGLNERPTQNARSTGQETHRATVGSPGQTANATMTMNQLVERKPDGKEPRNTHHRVPSGDRSRPADVRTMKKGKVLHLSRTPRNKDGRLAAKQ
jgi:hypothetical protein